MPLFHPRIIEKYTKTLSAIPETHLNILNTWAQQLDKGIFDRESSHDAEFTQRILIDVLGYSGSSAGDEWTVAKNQPVGSGTVRGNVDVALGYFSADKSRIIAPFELKGAKTHDLDATMPGRNKSPVQQAWEYAMDAKGAKWVLVSNYREIRLYAVGYGRKDYERFYLKELTNPVKYARFILLLSAPNLLGDSTLNLLKESEHRDKEITDRLYQDYKALRSEMIHALMADNPEVAALDIIQATQTILDRILFVAFAEDRGLLPKNTLKSCVEEQSSWNPQPLWGNFKGLFRAIESGNDRLGIPGYNGGLFAKDEVIEKLEVSDSLCESLTVLSGYDFESDVSVNILGHIFEQSISDLEELKAGFNGQGKVDKKDQQTQKRRNFYTPTYITRYIVEQAVGSWLNDRKQEIGFTELPVLGEEDYASIKLIQRGKFKGTIRYNANIEKHIQAWEAYKTVLSNVKILDPACGSGAFFNEVFDYLYREGEAINNELAVLNGGQRQLFRWDTHIIANNIYGVDINRESVEITKLSLWLKTANRSEQLTYLDDNIKLGNSLIDDVEVAGDLAFKWQEKFPDIMQAGGFDVVVGNPPYGAHIESHTKSFLEKKYCCFRETLMFIALLWSWLFH
ncbi:MAG: DNA methyltransferase [Deinococcales bacterium]